MIRTARPKGTNANARKNSKIKQINRTFLHTKVEFSIERVVRECTRASNCLLCNFDHIEIHKGGIIWRYTSVSKLILTYTLLKYCTLIRCSLYTIWDDVKREWEMLPQLP